MPLTLAPTEPTDSTLLAQRRDAAIAWLYGRINYEATPPARRGRRALTLERMEELAGRLGRPGLSIPTVHVAGTKGKGSTAAMIASVLHAAGYRTGLFTSPHLEQIEERFWVDGTIATPSEFVDLVDVVRPIVEEMDAACAGGRGRFGPTFFEICTALALLYFERRAVEAVVLEVGLGGRLDATNICRPAVCAITSISFDHTRQLGNTLAEIAREKAGIIKPGVPVVSGVTSGEAAAVIGRIARQRRAPLSRLGRDFTFTYHSGDVRASDAAIQDRFDYTETADDASRDVFDLPLPLIGEHQAANAALTIAMTGQLARQGWTIPDEALRIGLANVRLPARAEIVSRNPIVLLDTAHNVASVRALVEVLEHVDAQRRHLVFAATQDKDVAGMLALLLPRFDTVRLTQYKTNPRGVPVEELGQLVERSASMTDVQPQPRVFRHDAPVDAWRAALAASGAGDLIYITGSFFLAAELRTAVDDTIRSRGNMSGGSS